MNHFYYLERYHLLHRQEDIISSRELDNLKFSRREGFSQVVFLPTFKSAGVFEDVFTVPETPRDKPLVIKMKRYPFSLFLIISPCTHQSLNCWNEKAF